MRSHAHVMNAPLSTTPLSKTTTMSERFTNWMTSSLPWLSRGDAVDRTYEQWAEVFTLELGVVVMDDEGQRRCKRDGRFDETLTRREAEGYFLFNSLVKARRITA